MENTQQISEPWLVVSSNKSHFEDELEREVSSEHPLYGKSVKAIAHRQDRDDVLFEVHDSDFSYATVHLTYKKEHTQDFPLVSFFKDWNEVYINLIQADIKEWDELNQI